MPAKKKRRPARGETRPVKNGKAKNYVISAPNPYYEGRFLDGGIRFIEGKCTITDAQARALKFKDGLSNELVPFENAEQLVRYFMDMIGNATEDPARQYKVTPALEDLTAEAARVAPHFDRTLRGSGESEYIEVTPKEDAPDWAVNSRARPDEQAPNLGRSRRERMQRQRSAGNVRAAGIPAGADTNVVPVRSAKKDKEAVSA